MEANHHHLKKITFDLNGLNQKTPFLDYEFCIPKEETYVKKVKSIDKTIIFYPQSRGRIGCSENEYLCIGNTNQVSAKTVIIKLAKQDFINRIDQCFFE